MSYDKTTRTKTTKMCLSPRHCPVVVLKNPALAATTQFLPLAVSCTVALTPVPSTHVPAYPGSITENVCSGLYTLWYLQVQQLDGWLVNSSSTSSWPVAQVIKASMF